MSVFDAVKNNRGREDVGIYMAYATYEQRLLEAQQEERERLIDIVMDREEKMPWKDYSPKDVIDLLNGELQ